MHCVWHYLNLVKALLICSSEEGHFSSSQCHSLGSKLYSIASLGIVKQSAAWLGSCASGLIAYLYNGWSKKPSVPGNPCTFHQFQIKYSKAKLRLQGINFAPCFENVWMLLISLRVYKTAANDPVLHHGFFSTGTQISRGMSHLLWMACWISWCQWLVTSVYIFKFFLDPCGGVPLLPHDFPWGWRKRQ